MRSILAAAWLTHAATVKLLSRASARGAGNDAVNNSLPEQRTALRPAAMPTTGRVYGVVGQFSGTNTQFTKSLDTHAVAGPRPPPLPSVVA